MAEQPSVYHYSEIFHSVQGEGKYTGQITAWLRFFLCNLQCNGFGQKDPTDPSTYDLPYKKVAKEIEVNPLKYSSMEELPVFERGCDSSYSWNKAFKHLQRKGTAAQIAERIMRSMKTKSNPRGTFSHPNGFVEHMCFTGGEPLMPHGQKGSVEILEAFMNITGGPNYDFYTQTTRGNIGVNLPSSVTYETNGTQPLATDFIEFWNNTGRNKNMELFFSISPKLYTVSGEENKKAIRINNLKTYRMLSKNGQLKFVMGTKEEQWDELKRVLDDIRSVGIDYPVYIMPVGALAEQQEDVAGTVADMALAEGFNVSARVHCYLWGNKIGV